MRFLSSAAWILVLAISMATILLVPRELDYVYPADSTGQIFVTGTGIAPEDLADLAAEHGVEVSQVLESADYATAPGSSAGAFTTQTIEILGEDRGEGKEAFASSFFLPADIVYTEASHREDALGRWNATGPSTRVTAFVDEARERWGSAIESSSVLHAGDATRAAFASPLGRGLVLAEVSLVLILILAAASRPASFRSDRLAGRSGVHLLLHRLRAIGSAGLVWVLLPLGLFSALVALDRRNASTHLTINRLVTELAVGAIVLTIAAIFLGTLGGWAALLLTSRGRSRGNPSPSPKASSVLAAGTSVVALALVWSFASSSAAVVADIQEDQANRNQAHAQDALPSAYTLSFWGVSESTFAALEPRLGAFAESEEAAGSLVLVWATPDDTTPDASGPPTLYLNNTAAASYGLPTVSADELAIYRPSTIASQDGALTALMEQNAGLQRDFGSTIGNVTVVIHDQAEATTVLPADLPRMSYSLSGTSYETRDCLIAVVPDGYLAPANMLAAFTQGAAVITGGDSSVLDALTAHQLREAVSRVDAVGGGHTATLHPTTQRLILHCFVLLASGAAAIIAIALAARSWAQARRRSDAMSHLMGRRPRTTVAAGLVLAIPSLVLLALPVLAGPSHLLLVVQGLCALSVLVAIVVGSRQDTPHPLIWRRHRD